MKSFKEFMGNIQGKGCWFYGKIYYQLYLLEISTLDSFGNSAPYFSYIDDQMRDSIITGLSGDKEDPDAIP